MERHKKRGASARSGERVVWEADDWDPRFSQHMPDGTPVARSVQEIDDWARAENDATGRQIRVSRSDGAPTGEDWRAARLEDRRRIKEQRAAAKRERWDRLLRTPGPAYRRAERGPNRQDDRAQRTSDRHE